VNRGQKRAKGAAAVEDPDRRSGNRHLFTASAEVVELTSGARFSTRTTDLGPGGCFIDTTNPLPVGAKVRVSIRKGKNHFNTSGSVVYSQNGLGMGVSFTDMDEPQQRAIEAWIRGVYEDDGGTGYAARPQFDGKQAIHDGAPSVALMRLIRVLVSKGLLTETEGASILMDPVL
jgi:hypothetical protein